MSHLMLQASVETFNQLLKALDAILDKAAAHCEARGIDPTVLVGARLFPDMLPFSRQVQLACDFAARASSRLAGLEPLKFEDTEKTFPELKARIAAALAQVNKTDRDAIAASEARSITVPMGKLGEKTMLGSAYLFRFALPNFYFHVTTAYDILRENGVELGKFDFVGKAFD